MHSVLFVCTMNVCRSPIAMALLQHRVRKKAGEWRIESAGTWASEGLPAATKARQVLAERGIDLNSHRSRQVSGEMLQDFRLIITMEAGHKEALSIEFRELAGRVRMLTEIAGTYGDVADPIGGSLLDFKDAIQEIDRLLEKGFARIEALALEPDAP